MPLRKKELKVVSWYRKAAAYSIEDIFARKREPGPPRTVVINENLPDEYLDRQGKVTPNYVYTSNQVITSKYTIITFLPRNLLEQFRRLANMFFLAIAILQFFPMFSTISPGVAILPLVIIVTLTALKDGYEDYGRHQSDTKVNYSVVKVLAGGSWKNVNATRKKSKTFIRGLVNQIQSRPRLVPTRSNTKLGTQSATNADIEYDYDDAKEGGPHWKRTTWEDVRVGDFVKIEENQSFPADILICASSEDDNVAFVETKNLDGETNLKSRNSVTALTHLNNAASCAASSNSFHISCDRPEVNMYRLNAAVVMKEHTHSVDLQTTLLRGTVLRNTSWVIGIVLFTGEDTKIVLNSGDTPSKRSRVERQMNPQVFINLLLLATLATVCAISDSHQEKKYYPLNAPWMYGADKSDDNPRINGIITWAFAILTFQAVVPISLYLTIEVVRTLQAAFIYFDKDIWYEKTGQATLARSWNLSDDLGQIQYIFSDKTGTLTQNSMVFRQCSIGGKAYFGDPPADDEESDLSGKESTSIRSQPRKETVPQFRDSVLAADLDHALSENPTADDAAHARNLNGFFSVLALCHTVVADKDPESGIIRYKAQSPDEAALVQAAADVGFVFLNRDRNILSWKTPSSDAPERYELLTILEFTSARKRMSVVLRKLDGNDGRIFLLSKGADNVIFERLKAGNDELKAATERHLSDFANEGLRTLTLAYKMISEDDFAHWNERYHEATIAMEDREDKIEAISNELEQELRLLGATAIEDRLQDGVPAAIADLKRAGIKIWVATGDKLETAIAIGRSTNLVAPDSNIVIIRGGSRSVDDQMVHAFDKFFPDVPYGPGADEEEGSATGEELRRVDTRLSSASIVGEDNGDRPGGFVLVVDGAALLECFSSDERKDQLLRLAMQCDGVICCRVSPLQKALIVKLVKDGLGVMTLAIGDGANDVSMIQAADVGVGISGEEGLQAVNSSDYAIGQFRFLKKLLLVHGHWSYARNGTMILNFFYKNIVPTGVLWWFQIYCGWSATFAWDYIFILFWNSLWTIAPVAGIGLFDRFLDANVLMDVPELYHYGREAYWFSLKQFFVYVLDGIYQSVIVFFLIFNTYVHTLSPRSDGWAIAQVETGTVMALSGVIIVDLFTGLCATAWTWWMVFAVSIGIIIVWVFTAVYNAVSPNFSVTYLWGNNELLFHSPNFWFLIVLTVVLSLAPRVLAKAYKFSYVPDDVDIVRWIHKRDPHIDLANDSQTHLGIGLAVMKRHHRRVSSVPSAAGQSLRADSRAESVVTLERPSRPSFDPRSASRTDMSTGVVSVDRGFNFAMEEGGVAMNRMQSNLSEKRIASNPTLHPSGRPKAQTSRFSLKRGRMSTLLRKSTHFDGAGTGSTPSP